MGAFKQPRGGKLKNLYLDATAADAEKQAARDSVSPDLAAHRILVKLESMGFIK